jgi:hypothetical protein
MKTTLILLGMVFSIALNAQQSSVENIFKSFEGKEGVTTVHLTSDLMKMASDVDVNDKEMNSVFGMISEVRILSFGEAVSEDKVAFKSMIKAMSLNDYKVLMTVKDKDQDVKLLSKDNNGKVTEFLMIMMGDKHPTLISITGNIELAKLKKLSGKVNIDGFQHLAKLHNK